MLNIENKFVRSFIRLIKNSLSVFLGGMIISALVMCVSILVFGYNIGTEKNFTSDPLEAIEYVMLVSFIPSTYFLVSFLLTTLNKQVNLYVLGIASGIYFFMDAFIISRTNSSMFWVYTIGLGIILNIIFFRRDFFREIDFKGKQE